MPQHLQAKVAIKADTFQPRDAMVNTLHFDHATVGTGSDASDIAAELCALYKSTWCGSITEIECDVYDLGDAKPRHPIGHAIVDEGVGPRNSTFPREVAVCLSFYAGTNDPRRRGRIYLPAGVADSAANLGGVRPATALMNRALSMATGFAAIGPPEVTWQVRSSITEPDVFRPVTNAFVDDEWDTVRRRGLRASTRVTSTPGA
jgi:hypothetical protein